jgi:CRP-like cAMP-binding protein
MVNLSRSTASSVLGDLAAKGWIDLGYRTISVRDPGALAVLADGA